MVSVFVFLSLTNIVFCVRRYWSFSTRLMTLQDENNPVIIISNDMERSLFINQKQLAMKLIQIYSFKVVTA